MYLMAQAINADLWQKTKLWLPEIEESKDQVIS